MSPVFKVLVDEAFKLNSLSKGLFDPSLSPLINLWGFGPKGRRNGKPNQAEINATKKLCGMSNFKISQNLIEKLYSKSELDFSSFAKGYGVDLVVFYLESIQMDDYFVEIGGEVRTRTSNKVWRVGIEKPDFKEKGRVSKILKLNGALATSGDYRNFYSHDGKTYSHGINFDSGRPVENDIASVSVFHPISTMRADGWATALMVTDGIQQAKEIIKTNSLAAYIIFRKGNEINIFESKKWREEFKDD